MPSARFCSSGVASFLRLSKKRTPRTSEEEASREEGQAQVINLSSPQMQWAQREMTVRIHDERKRNTSKRLQMYRARHARRRAFGITKLRCDHLLREYQNACFAKMVAQQLGWED